MISTIKRFILDALDLIFYYEYRFIKIELLNYHNRAFIDKSSFENATNF